MLLSGIALLEQAESFPTPTRNDDGNIIRSAVTDGLLNQLIGDSLRGLFDGDGRQGDLGDNAP